MGKAMARKHSKKPTITPTRDIGSLLVALDDPDSVVRRTAVEALGHIDSSEATAALIRMLRDSDSNVRSWAAGMLGGVGFIPGRSEAVEPLITRPYHDLNLRS
jgi:HEAT repeat protein